MHDDGIRIDADLVRQLIKSQFPQWSALPLRPLSPAGVDNVAFRLGDALLVRLPRRTSSCAALGKEQLWLPWLRGKLPLPVPEVVGHGRPEDAFPWPWSAYRWIEGESVAAGAVADWRALARALAAFVRALQDLDPSGGPAPGEHNSGRGAPLATRDRITRDAVAGLPDRDALLPAWDADSCAPSMSGPARWLHGDLHARNLLQRGGALHAVIDFGCLGVGDPACDIAAAWRLLPRDARPTFRDALRADDDAWRRGRAWALSVSVRELAYYGDAAPALTQIARRTIREVLRDHAGA